MSDSSLPPSIAGPCQTPRRPPWLPRRGRPSRGYHLPRYRRMKTAIIGCGVISPTFAKALALDGRVELAWAIDPLIERAKALGARRAGADWRAAVEDRAIELV